MKTIRKMSINFILIAAVALLVSCTNPKNDFDAQGNFEAIEVVTSAEGTGKIVELNIEEGDVLTEGSSVGLIDTIQLDLKRAQLHATIKALEAKLPNVAAQVNVLKEQLSTAEYERERIKRLLATQSATPKQLDDYNAQIALIKSQIIASTAQLDTQTRGILAEIEPLRVQLLQLNDQVNRCKITAPIAGTVLSKFVECGEFTTTGKPLFKMANLSKIILKAYVAGNQLTELTIGQAVTAYTDKADGGYNEYKGTVTWISNKAEFTPKVIQTKDERVNLVYAFKVVVDNDGSLKIGMPGEVKFQKE